MTAPRLLILAPTAYPLGGVATWLDHLIPGLRHQGFDATLGLLAGKHHDVDAYLRRHPDPHHITIVSRTGSREGRVRALARSIRAERPDLVVAVNVADVEAAVGRCHANGVTGPRLAVTQHALQSDFFDHLRVRRAAVDGVICTNRLSCALAARYSGVEAGRIHYAPYGVPQAATAPSAADGLPLRIAWVGRIEQEQKRVLDLPGICAALDRLGIDFGLTVAGCGGERERLASELRPWTDRGAARLFGPLAPAELHERVYAHADLLLITSCWETGPIVAWEAAMAGLAVVTSDFLGRGLEGALAGGRSVWVYPIGDTEEAARALARAADPRERAVRVSALRAAVAERYSIEMAASLWSEALRAVLADVAGAARRVEEMVPPAGRLDRWLGVRRGESLRSALGARSRPAGPGDEWPHAYGLREDPEFARLAARLDHSPEMAFAAEPQE